VRSLRLSTRLALLAAAGVSVVVGAFAFGAYRIIAVRAREHIDESLERTARAAQRSQSQTELGVRDFSGPVAPVTPVKPTPKPTPQGPSAAPPTRVKVLPRGKPVPGTTGGKRATVTATPTGQPRTVTLDGERVRLLVVPLPRTSDGRQLSLAVFRPLADVENTLDEVAWSLGLGALIASAMAMGAALLLSRRALRPLVQVQSAAEQVADSQDLSVRIAEGRPDEVGRLARAVNTMLSRLEDAQGRLTGALEDQRRFAADASHELRTPLTALKGDIDLLARHELPEDERRVVLDEMAATTERMGRLVSGLLALARAEATDVERAEPVELLTLLAEADPGGRVDTEEQEVLVQAEPDALRAIFGNLIDNARRHGGRSRVGVRSDGRQAVVVVSDDGPGIAEAERQRIFDRFYRSPAQRGQPGAGLGLAIARSAAERTGGALTLLPANGRGAQFEVRLPLVRAKEPDGTTAWARPRVVRGR
jgi:signal transduction histidine kinase